MSKYSRPAFGEKQVGRYPLSLPITVSENLEVSISVRLCILLSGQKKEHDAQEDDSVEMGKAWEPRFQIITV